MIFNLPTKTILWLVCSAEIKHIKINICNSEISQVLYFFIYSWLHNRQKKKKWECVCACFNCMFSWTDCTDSIEYHLLIETTLRGGFVSFFLKPNKVSLRKSHLTVHKRTVMSSYALHLFSVVVVIAHAVPEKHRINVGWVVWSQSRNSSMCCLTFLHVEAVVLYSDVRWLLF